ncbi:MAG: hypothetical protein JWP30_1206 [Homoserinimonas sp.]|jgi:dolichyl-phosphate-mannose-protein mannosyltransferase|nr:hypothetical protein [Homoserinimonas sp.]
MVTATRVDAWWGRMLSTPRRRTMWQWAGPTGVTLLAAILRLWNLGHPHALVLDETYYVKDAYTLLNLGYEAAWPNNADPDFEAGRVDTFTTDPSFVVHPPLGKWLIALGLASFGAESSVGWRISTAIAGVVAVALICLAAQLLFKSTVLTTVAGGLMAIDGQAIVMSRVAMLDNFVMLFALLGFITILLDRRHSQGRLAKWMLRDGRSDWGPALWWRPWLVAAGVFFGLTAAVKWSGLYFLAAFAVYTLGVDALARRRAGVPFWLSGTILKQGPVSFLLTVPVAAAVYVASWRGWFTTSGGYYRQWAQETSNSWPGALAWVPLDWQNFWHYNVSVYNFHIGLSTPHSYQADPWSWLLLTRPTSFYYDSCESAPCAQLITSLANPIMWWAAVGALVYLMYRLVRFHDWQVGLILMGVAAGYLPWLLYPDRTVFQFYTIAFEPYLLLGLTFALGRVLGTRNDAPWRRLSGIRLLAIFLIFAVLVSAYFFPVWTGLTMPDLFIRSHYWLPGWR